MAQGSFSLSLATFARKYEEKAETLVKAVALDVLKTIVLRTPVDTGRARGNWQVTIGVPATGRLERLDKQGAAAIASGSSAVAGFKVGPTIWLVNNLPYAVRLEYGWSKQAPAGMVRLTQREWSAKVARIAQGMSR